MFMTALLLQPYAPNEWAVAKDLRWVEVTEVGKRPLEITVPRGFITDLASVPRALRPVLNVNGTSRAAAVLHDWLYCSQRFSRSVSDAIFRRALAAEGMNILTRNIYYAGVRAGGWVYWGLRARGVGLGRDDFIPAGWWEAHP